MRIKIGDEFVDLFENEVIAQTYSVNEIGSIETRQGGFSNDFQVPLTSKNRVILGIPDDINTASRNAYTKVEASLVDTGAVVADGYLKYTVVSGNVIQISFFSDNVEWFSLIKDKKLADLDLSEFNHTWDYQNIATAINADKSSGYTYPLIDYGEFELATDLSADTTQMFPAIFVSSLVKRIFFEIGWKVEGPMIDHPMYKKMIIPFCGRAFTNVSINPENFAITTADQDFTGTVDQEIVWVSPEVIAYTATQDTIHSITFTTIFGVDPETFTGTFYFEVRKNGVVIDTSDVFNNSGTTTLIINQENMVDGDELTVGVVKTGAGIMAIQTASITVVVSPLIQRGQTVIMSDIMPDIKQSDLIKYLVFIFGAVPQANVLSKTVTFSLFNSVKNNLANALDWSNKIDLSFEPEMNFTELLNKYGSTSILRYKEDANDNELIAYENETGQRFGQGQFDIQNEFISKIVTLYEAPFSSMININSFDNQIYIPQIRFKQPGESDLTPVPKVALLSSNIAVSELTNGLFTRLRIYDNVDEYASDYEDVTEIPFCWFAKTEYVPSVDALVDSLVFDQILFPNVSGLPIIERFLQDYEQILNSMKYVKARFHLQETDISALDFTQPIYIDYFKAYFFLSKINDYQGSSITTECELVKIP